MSSRNDEALEEISFALAASPERAWFWAVKGAIVRALGREQEACQALLNAIERDNSQPSFWTELADTLLVLGDHPKAFEASKKAHELAGDHATARGLGIHGRILIALGKSPEAAEVLEKALAANETLAWVWFDLGVAYRNMERYDDAVKALDRGLQLDPNSNFGLQLKREALCHFGQYPESLEILDRLPGSAPNFETRAQTLRLLQNHAEALRWFDKALELDADLAPALLGKADTLSDIAEYEEAAKLAQRVVDMYPGNADAQYSLGWALEHVGRQACERALEAYKAAQEINDCFIGSLRGIGDLLLRMGRHEEALKHFETIIKDWDGKQQLRAAEVGVVAWAHMRLKNYDRAFDLFFDLTSLDHGALYANFDLALSLLLSGRRELGYWEYQRTVAAMARRQLPSRGVLFIAWHDLNVTMEISPEAAAMTEAQLSLELLKNAAG